MNSLWLSDAIWWHRSGSTLVQVMACCLLAQSHYLNRCWLLISEVLWHSPQGKFTVRNLPNILLNELENSTFKISAISPRGQWVNKWHAFYAKTSTYFPVCNTLMENFTYFLHYLSHQYWRVLQISQDQVVHVFLVYTTRVITDCVTTVMHLLCKAIQHFGYTYLVYSQSLFVKLYMLASYTQYDCCWWPGDTSSQDISNHGGDPVIADYSGFSTKRFNKIYFWAFKWWLCLCASSDIFRLCYL